MNLSKLQNEFVQIAKCICQNCKIYLFKLQNVFVQIGFLFPHKAWFPAGRSQLRPFEGGPVNVCTPVNALFTPVCWSPPTKGRRKEMLNARAKKYWMREGRNTECTAKSHYSSWSGAGAVKINRIWPIIQNKRAFPSIWLQQQCPQCQWQLECAFATFETCALFSWCTAVQLPAPNS